MVSIEHTQDTQQTAAESRQSTGPVLAIIPAYNEDRFISGVVLKAQPFVDEVIVIDDGSMDQTAWLAEKCGARVIRQPHNRGKAAAVNAGFAVARELKAVAVVMLDGDGQHSPADIPTVLKPILSGDADIVVGSRFLGVTSNTPRSRIFGQHALTVATNLASGVPLTDSQTGFRALSRQAVEKLAFTTSGFSLESEMQFLIKDHNLKVCEVPIEVNYDEGPKRNPISHGLQVLNGILRIIGQNRPLFFFGVPGLTVMLLGILGGLTVIDSYNRSQRFAIGSGLISITLVILGMLCMFTGIILHTIRAYMTE
ncbi:MAG TPA: glycosyltransferase family 2 protein [Aggregatilineales bacterium]|nr:glycosyltransferase family 2 protein [Aggregatilineales bacterium]